MLCPLTLGLVVGLRAIPSGQAQKPVTVPLPAVSPDEATKLASGWMLLARGQHREAAQYGESLLAQFPRSPSVLAFAVEGAIAGRGAYAALDTYERWLNAAGRTLEEPGPLSRIGRAVLHEWARQTTDPSARLDALKILAAEGVQEASAVLSAGAQAGGIGETRALVALGDARAIDRVVGELKEIRGLKLIEIMTLGESRSPRVIRPLIDLLADQEYKNRAEAAAALGKVGGAEAIAPLKGLLNDPNGGVRIQAAASLLKLGDTTGLPILRELVSNESPEFRRSALTLLASYPDEEWKNLVRGLAASSDPSFRLDAARLLAPHDEAFSKSILDSLLLDGNPGIREAAGIAVARDSLRADFPALRKLLRVPSGRVRVAAAERLLKSVR